MLSQMMGFHFEWKIGKGSRRSQKAILMKRKLGRQLFTPLLSNILSYCTDRTLISFGVGFYSLFSVCGELQFAVDVLYWAEVE